MLAFGLVLAVTPVAGAAGPDLSYLFLPASSRGMETPLEAQILSDTPRETPRNPYELALRELIDDPTRREQEGPLLTLPRNVKVRISFRYGGETPTGEAHRQPGGQPLLVKSSFDYALFPNLQVGLSGFLYHGATDSRYFQRRYGDVVMGLGPGLRYDLGRWSFTLQSQYGTKGRDQKEGLQNWFRVWYAF